MNSLSFKTNFGWISVFEDKKMIVKIKFGKHRNKSVSQNLKKIKTNIINFLNKKAKVIKSNFFVEGSPIQKKIWEELTKIKLGQTKSYNEIAKKYKISPRYVGKICGQNKLVLAIPCHRVIRSDGNMGGFSGEGGVNLKTKLLKFEEKWKQ